MRQGEILALRWSDLDLDRASAQIQRSIQFVTGRYIFTPPKTAKSRRKVELTQTAIAAPPPAGASDRGAPRLRRRMD